MDIVVNFAIFFVALWILVGIGMEAFDIDGGFSIGWDKAKVAAIVTAMITAFISFYVFYSKLLYD